MRSPFKMLRSGFKESSVPSSADVLEMLAGGMGVDEILNDYPYLEKMDIEACLHYAAIAAKHEEVKLSREHVA